MVDSYGAVRPKQIRAPKKIGEIKPMQKGPKIIILYYNIYNCMETVGFDVSTWLMKNQALSKS